MQARPSHEKILESKWSPSRAAVQGDGETRPCHKKMLEAQLSSTRAVLQGDGEDADLKKTLAQYQHLFGITSRLNAEATTGEALRELVASVYSIVDVQRVSVYISQGWEFGELAEVKQVLGSVISGDSVDSSVKLEISGDIKKSVAGFVAFSRSSQILENIPANPLISDDDPIKKYRNAILVPILIGTDNTSVGVLECVNKNLEEESFTQVDLVILQCIASAAGNALHKIVLFDQALNAQRKTSALLELANASRHIHEDTHIDLPKLIERLLMSVFKVMHTERVRLYICDAVGRHLWSICPAEDATDKIIPYGSGIIGTVANTDASINVFECSADMRYSADYDSEPNFIARTMLATPVRYSNGGVAAVLVVWNKCSTPYENWESSLEHQLQPFSKEDEFVLDSIARQIGDILERNALDTHYENIIHEIVHLKSSDIDKILTASLLAETTNKSFYLKETDFPLVFTSTTPARRNLFLLVSKLTYFFKAIGYFHRKLLRIRGYRSHITSGLRSPRVDCAKFFDDTQKKSRRYSLDSQKRQLRSRSHSEIMGLNLMSKSCAQGGDDILSLEKLVFCDYCMDVFTVGASAGPILVYKSLEALNLVSPFKMAENSVLRFTAAIRDAYLPKDKCPYHNWDHALGVYQMTFALLYKELVGLMEPIHMLAILVASIGHDAGHMGRNNEFEVKLGSRLAILYNDKSVLEQHHASTVFQLLNVPGNNILQFASRREMSIFRKTTVESILGTDMSCHVDVVKSITHRLDQNFDVKSMFGAEDTIVQITKFILHSVDIAGQTYPENLSDIWSQRLIDEFIDQTEDEVALALKPAPYMVDLHLPVNAMRMQYSFTSNIVLPCWKTMAVLFPSTQVLVGNLEHNAARFQNLANEM